MARALLRGGSGGSAGLDEAARLAQAAELMATPRLWDDLVEVVAWLRGVGERAVTDEGGSGGGGGAARAVEPDPEVRALAAGLLRSAILQELVLGPLEAEEEGE